MSMLSQSPGIVVALTLLAQPVGAQDRSETIRPATPGFAEPNPPSLESLAPAMPAGPSKHAAATEPYTIGDPTDEEQQYVELVNRARANPQAEVERLLTSTDSDVRNALSFFKVDLALARSQFADIRPAPPVSIHPQLTAAARVHCNDMFQNEFQGHVGTDGSSVGTRVTRAGYRWNGVAENVFSYAQSVIHGHAGFEIDWGEGEGGMQTPPGHRNTIHNKAFREIGVGVIQGSKGPVGPQLVVQEFAYHTALTPFITGVVYYDLNGNQAYDPGEGIGGVKVSVGGSSRTGLSARSGGYSVPVIGNGAYSVTFEVPGMGAVSRLANVVDNENVKVDLVPAYAPAVVSGPSVASKDRNNTYTFTAVGGATAYEWRSMKREAWSAPETATEGLGRFEAAVASAYSPIANGVNGASGACFHLAHPAPPGNQYLTLKTPLQIGAGSELTFRSRLGSSAADQAARV
ncbi:MAG: hypothetical protein J0L84_20635, partial [Verrucomicrobia bacterium]|nr:hypothetical protein [Verrucomicrobiota bacterium]